MKKPSFDEALGEILLDDPRYAEAAYHFIREALDHTIRTLDKPHQGPGRHVSGQELLEGIREYAVAEYGPLTRTVLAQWGVESGIDFGHIVFNLVGRGILGKTESDRVEDFAEGYDFAEAFDRPFLPDPAPASSTAG